jgi:hypothetical protein
MPEKIMLIPVQALFLKSVMTKMFEYYCETFKATSNMDFLYNKKYG